MNTHKTAYAYVRVSTNAQEELSPDAQIRLIKDYASKNNIIISRFFVENGISGRTAEKRPEFMEMIATCKQESKNIDVILVWKFSRFARNQEESIVYKSLLKKQHDIDVISISEPLIEGPFGSLIERIIEWMDEYYSVRLSGEVVRGMTEKALRGGYQANPPLGYIKHKGQEVPTINEDEAKIVRHIFSSALSGKGNWALANELNELGYRSKRGNLFQARNMRYILENPFYAGMVRWNYFDKENNKAKDESEVIVVKGQHEPIITLEEYEQAKALMAKTKLTYKRKPAGTYKHWLSGICKCYKCGGTLSYGQSGNSKYMRCSNYNHNKCDNSRTVNLAMLEDHVIQSLKQVIDSNYIYYSRPTYNGSQLDKATKLQSQLEKLSIKESRIKEAYRDGIDTLEEYKQNKNILMKEQKAIQLQLDDLKKETVVDDTARMLDNVGNVYHIIQSDADVSVKSDYLKSIISKIIYNQDSKTLEVEYHYIP